MSKPHLNQCGLEKNTKIWREGEVMSYIVKSSEKQENRELKQKQRHYYI